MPNRNSSKNQAVACGLQERESVPECSSTASAVCSSTASSFIGGGGNNIVMLSVPILTVTRNYFCCSLSTVISSTETLTGTILSASVARPLRPTRRH
jgi:hypothetical protein